MKPAGEPLSLGAEIIQWLLPYRRPFLMLDRIEAYARTPIATIQSSRCLSINEPVFAGHFPQLAMFPGSLILEGGCQTAHMLVFLVEAQKAYEERGDTAGLLLEQLSNLERGFRLDPGYDAGAAALFLGELQGAQWMNLGMTASTHFKFLKPVFAGQRITYTVRLTRTMQRLYHYEIEAAVEGQLVAKGTNISALIEQAPPRLPAMG